LDQDFLGIIRRAVINNDHFRMDRIRQLRRAQACEQPLQARPSIERRHDDTYVGK
jgi:hypothetical protein